MHIDLCFCIIYRRYLYGAVLDRPESAAKKVDKTKGGVPGPIPFSKAKVMPMLIYNIIGLRW